MKVLVTAASRHGSTAEISRAIARTLEANGVTVDLVEPDAVGSIDGYDAAILGSGVYMGRWLEPARRLVSEHEKELGRVPVWLFSSGPTGDPLVPAEDPTDAAPMVERTGAREHRVFGGVIDRRKLGLTEKAIVTMVRACDGDYRQWNDIDQWAAGIASALRAPAAL